MADQGGVARPGGRAAVSRTSLQAGQQGQEKPYTRGASRGALPRTWQAGLQERKACVQEQVLCQPECSL